MNQRPALFRFQKLSDIRRADFELERHGYTVERLNALAFHFLAVLVQVNEPRSYHQTLGMDYPFSGQHVGRDADDLSVAYSDVSHAIQAGFGIHDTAAFEHEIILLCRDDGRC